MLIIGSDTETTGLTPGDHRFVEVYASVWDWHKRTKVSEFHSLIDPQRSIPAESARIHGFTAADLAGKPTWEMVAQDFRETLESGIAAVFHNAEFDTKFINYELKRIGKEPLNVPIVDTFLQGRFATPYGKAPSLKELCVGCDVDYDPAQAHRADYDTERMMICLFKAVDWGFIKIGNNGEVIADAA